MGMFCSNVATLGSVISLVNMVLGCFAVLVQYK